jgi:molybdopterin converting factor small subunit
MEAVKLNLIFFGPLKKYFGEHMAMHLSAGTSLKTIIQNLQEKEPDAINILASCQIAVDSELETQDFIITQTAEIAILPPFSGG